MQAPMAAGARELKRTRPAAKWLNGGGSDFLRSRLQALGAFFFSLTVLVFLAAGACQLVHVHPHAVIFQNSTQFIKSMIFF